MVFAGLLAVPGRQDNVLGIPSTMDVDDGSGDVRGLRCLHSYWRDRLVIHMVKRRHSGDQSALGESHEGKSVRSTQAMVLAKSFVLDRYRCSTLAFLQLAATAQIRLGAFARCFPNRLWEISGMVKMIEEWEAAQSSDEPKI